MGAYISNQVKMHAYHLNFETLDNSLENYFIRENSNEIHQMEGQLEIVKDRNCCWKVFRIFPPGQAAHEK